MEAEKIPYFSFEAMHADLGAAPHEVFRHFWEKQWYVLGDSLAAFERQYAGWNGVRHCIGVGNCYDSIYLPLLALAPEPGAEIIVPANAGVYVWLAVLRAGAVPRPVDVGEQTHTIDPAGVEAAIGAHTRGIIPVHYQGRACEMQPILDLAEQHGLFVLEDNGQAHGACYAGKKTGSFGIAAGTSFYPTKILGAAGDAAAVTTDDDALAARLRQLRNYGAGRKNDHELLGANARLDELQAALLALKMPHLDTWIAQRRMIARRYLERLEGVQGLLLPAVADPESHSWLAFPVCADNRADRVARLAAQNIGFALPGEPPVYLQTAYRHLGFRRGDFPVTERIADTGINLPLYPGLSDARVDRICATLDLNVPSSHG